VRTWIVWSAVVVVLFFSTETLFGADDDADPELPLGRGVRRVWGEVKEISLEKMKLAIEVEIDEDKKEIQIFLLTKDTKVRKQEHARSLDDVKKGASVVVFYRPVRGKDETPTALVVRIYEGRRYGPKKP